MQKKSQNTLICINFAIGNCVFFVSLNFTRLALKGQVVQDVTFSVTNPVSDS